MQQSFVNPMYFFKYHLILEVLTLPWIVSCCLSPADFTVTSICLFFPLSGWWLCSKGTCVCAGFYSTHREVLLTYSRKAFSLSICSCALVKWLMRYLGAECCSCSSRDGNPEPDRALERCKVVLIICGFQVTSLCLLSVKRHWTTRSYKSDLLHIHIFDFLIKWWVCLKLLLARNIWECPVFLVESTNGMIWNRTKLFIIPVIVC